MTSPTAGIDAWTAEQERTAALHRAVYAGDAAAVTALLDAGANINARDRRGFSPLARATERRRYALALMLLARGADPNTFDRRGRTPLYWVAEYGTAELARGLLARGASPAAGRATRYSILQIAVRAGRAEVARVIAEAEAWARLPKWSGEPWKRSASALPHFDIAFSQAVKQGRGGAVRALLGGEFDTQMFGDSPHGEQRRPLVLAHFLCIAARLGHISVIRILVENGADVATDDAHGKMPLTEALAAGQTEAASVLRELGAPYGIREAIELADLDFLEDAIQRKEFDLGNGWDSSSGESAGEDARALYACSWPTERTRMGSRNQGTARFGMRPRVGLAQRSRCYWSTAPTCSHLVRWVTPHFLLPRDSDDWTCLRFFSNGVQADGRRPNSTPRWSMQGWKLCAC